MTINKSDVRIQNPWKNDCSGSILEPLTQCHHPYADLTSLKPYS